MFLDHLLQDGRAVSIIGTRISTVFEKEGNHLSLSLTPPYIVLVFMFIIGSCSLVKEVVCIRISSSLKEHSGYIHILVLNG